MKTVYRVWDEARIEAFNRSKTSRRCRLDLRHACISTWVASGVEATQVTKLASHSVAVLMKVYAKCLDDHEDAAERRIEAMFPATRQPNTKKWASTAPPSHPAGPQSLYPPRMDYSAWSALFAGASATAAIATSGIAGWALFHQRRDSHDRTRPVVIATLRPGPSTVGSVLYLVIKNAGGTLARNVRVSFDPPIPTDEEARTMVSVIGERYADAIPLIVPGETLTNVYLMFTRDEGAPPKVTVTVTYADDRRRTYTDRFPLDVAIYDAQSSYKPSGDDTQKRLAKATEALVWETWTARL